MKKLIFLIINCIFLTSLAFGQITIDGNITETEWGTALSTSSGNLNSTVDANNKVNALYLTNENDGNFLLGIAGNIVFGNRILVFIDSKSGGYNDCSFDRTNAPPGSLNGLNAGIIFDTGFEADYCLSIGRDNGNPITYYFDLFKLSSTGSNSYLGSSADANFGATPSTTDNTKGFEARISLSDVEYSGTGGITVMVMYAADDGTLTNQFLSPANDGQGDYGNGAVDFNNEPPNPVSVSASILPVELATFYGKANHSTIDLYWTTLSEENNAGFDIEKSINGKDFEIIGHVEGAGNSIEKVDYGFIDNYPFNGLNYYRLKQTDFDGSSTYSKVISTIFNKKIDTKIFPNPARNQLYLAVNQQLLGTIRIIDINGQIIFSQQQLINNTTAIDLSNLLNGIYYLEIISDESQQIFSTTFSKL